MAATRMNKTILTSLFFALAVVILAVPAWADDSGYALLVQQSPAGGGSVNLGAGVHKMEIGQTVTLSATPKSGYRFLYWLGDVSAADTADTQIQIDSPKMVVAVFARDEFDEDIQGVGLTDGAGGGGGGQRGAIDPVRSPASVSGGSNYEPADVIYNFTPPEDDNKNDFPVPGGEEVPEPATLLLLGLGSAVFLKRKRQ